MLQLAKQLTETASFLSLDLTVLATCFERGANAMRKDKILYLLLAL